MPVDLELKVGDRANNIGHPPIIITDDYLRRWGQELNIHARNTANEDVEGLKTGMHGFYVYKVSCKCDSVQRSGVESVIKVGRSAAPKKADKDVKIDGSLEYGGLKARLLSYPVNYSMVDTELLMVIIFNFKGHVENFESSIKSILNSHKKYKAVGTEWFDAKYETKIMEHIEEHRGELKQKYRPTPASSPAPGPSPPRAAAPSAPRRTPTPGAGGSGNTGGPGVVHGTGSLATAPQAQPRSARVYQSKPPPPRTASLDVKKKYVKNAAMKLRRQADRDGKTDAYQKEIYKKETDKWNAYYGLN